MKKIMFDNAFGLTEAVLEGRKTMTRRIAQINKKPCQSSGCVYCQYHDHERGCDWILEHSRYHLGEVLAVAQRYKDVRLSPEAIITHIRRIHYVKAYRAPRILLAEKNKAKDDAGWNNKMFVRADLMPHQIRITNVRVERLHDITENDCLREGVVKYTCNLFEYVGVCYSYQGDKERMGTYKTPRDAFAALIDKISGKGTWDKNPWVFVYEFKLVK